jgi:hypothetical protein
MHISMHLVEQDPEVLELAVAVGGEVGAADGVYDGLVPPLVRHEVVVLAEVGVGGRRLRVLQARHARRLRELVVIYEVVQRHVHRRRRPVWLAARTAGSARARAASKHTSMQHRNAYWLNSRCMAKTEMSSRPLGCIFLVRLAPSSSTS